VCEKSLHKRSLSYLLRHIGDWSHHTNNSFFKLVKALLQIDCCFFSHSIRLHCFTTAVSTQQSLSRCNACQYVYVQQTHATKRPRNFKEVAKDLLPCYCYAVKTDSRILSQLSQTPLQAKKRPWLNCKLQTRNEGSAVGAKPPLEFFSLPLKKCIGHTPQNLGLSQKTLRPPVVSSWLRAWQDHHCIISELWTWRLCGVSVVPANELTLHLQELSLNRYKPLTSGFLEIFGS